MSAVDDFLSIAGESTFGSPKVNWGAVVDYYGVEFPGDYKAISERYFSIAINGRLLVALPSAFGGTEEDFLGIDLLRRDIESMKRGSEFDGVEHPVGVTTGVRVPYPLHPEVPGLLPWGETDTGIVCLWLTSQAAGDWTIVVTDYARWEHYECSLSEFLVSLMRGEIVNSIISGSWSVQKGVEQFSV
ncbi:hypothetical protein [Allonocardiopsis opalescens]|uniref:hypothetical protein n=1 Tax=Allonocardiopsis opalescens TaxID=1144618 RepID=UPI0011B1D1B5|nr:hypothetical protein [Allonocardiopsis opalescens]